MSALEPTLCIGDSIKPLPEEYDIVSITPVAGAGSTCKVTNQVNGQVLSGRQYKKPDADLELLYQGIRNEAQVSGHSHVLALRAAYESESFLYSINEPYEELLSSKDAGHLPEATVARWTLQILQALIHCHSNDIVHCSVNPNTIALVVNEGQLCVKLTGFEHSQICRSTDFLSRRLPATPYCAPEVQNGYYTSAADLRSLGGVLHYLLSGQAPSELDGELGDGIKFGSGYWDTVSDALKDFLRKVFSKPHARPTASQLLHHPWLQPL